jgi:aminoglycoside phosphotransferase (APT) family kinase protein
MSSPFEPPPSDRELDERIVRLTMMQQFPALELQTVEPLGSGWEYHSYLIDRHLVVKFPRYAEVAEGLDAKHARLEFVGSEIGSCVAVPRITLRGEASAFFPHRFFGHQLIPGVDANNPSVPQPNGLATDVGHALSCTHGISPDAAARLGIGPQKWTCRTSFEGLLRVREQVPTLDQRVL